MKSFLGRFVKTLALWGNLILKFTTNKCEKLTDVEIQTNNIFKVLPITTNPGLQPNLNLDFCV